VRDVSLHLAWHLIGSVCIDSVPATVVLNRVRSDQSCLNVSQSLFGKVLSHCMRIEWQVRCVAIWAPHCNYYKFTFALLSHQVRRRLPHAHILIILGKKVIHANYAGQMDAIICAEIP